MSFKGTFPALLLATTALVSSQTVHANVQKNAHSPSLWGGVGLIKTRNARFDPDGQFNVGMSFVNPTRRYHLTWQIFPWVEATFRYSDIRNWDFNFSRISTLDGSKFWSDLIQLESGETNLDRGFDFKFKLVDEKQYMPQIAVGLQDFLGTSLWSGEYVVASKMVGNFDVSMGLGWGQVSTSTIGRNPLTYFSSSFEFRDKTTLGIGGIPSYKQFFRGKRVGFFAGVEYLSPIEGLSFKAEYEGNDPDKDKILRVQSGRFPMNFAVNYKPADWFDVQVGLVRGNAFSLNFSLKTNFIGDGAYKPPKPVIDVPTRIYTDRANIDVEEFQTLTKGKTAVDYQGLYRDLNSLGTQVKYQAFEDGVLYITLAANEDKDDDDLSISSILGALDKAMPDFINTIVLNGPHKIAGSYSRSSRDIINAVDVVMAHTAPNTSGLSSNQGTLTIAETISHETQEEIANALTPYFSALQFGNEPTQQDQTIDLSVLRAQQQAEEVFASLNEISAEPTGLSIIDSKLVLNDSVRSGESVLRRAKLASSAKYLGANQIEITNDDLYDSEGVRQFSQQDHNRHGQMIFAALAPFGIGIDGLEMIGDEATIRITGTFYRKQTQTLYFAIRHAARNLPAEIEFITIKQVVGDVEIGKARFPRAAIEKMSAGELSADELLLQTDILQPDSTPKRRDMPFELDHDYPNFSWSLQPKIKQHVGEPYEGVVLMDLNALLVGTVNLAQGLNFTAIGKQYIIGNIDRVNRKSDSILPHVRSDLIEYNTQGRTSIARLQLDYSTQFAQNWYVRGTAGIMEDMFAGVGAEVLYRPWNRRWAVSFDWNWVKQRHYKQLFGFRKYSAWTGHATLYYDVPVYDMRVKLSAGQYLAGDRGVTIDISRQFSSGVRIGAFSTFTNVSAREFGEGSFDKGFYLNFPMELFLQTHTRQMNHFMFRPLTRDGGQKLHVGPELYGYIDNNQVYDLQKEWMDIYK